MEKNIKEKRLEILSLAMDINEKHGAIIFIDYLPHTEGFYVRIFEKPWSRDDTENKSKNYTMYDNDKSMDEVVVKHDTVLDILKGML